MSVGLSAEFHLSLLTFFNCVIQLGDFNMLRNV